MQKRICKFEIQDMLPIGLTFVVLGIGIAYGLNVMSDVRDDMQDVACSERTDGFTSFNETSGMCANATSDQLIVTRAEYVATNDAISGVAKIPEKLPLIATVIVAAIIIGILVRYLMVNYQ